ncbi:hypothetical protein ERJ75_001379400 [Trypanosoma vivax]|nr:hypothetical protein ERJ75_001379400 [Trypanosoma vivax]
MQRADAHSQLRFGRERGRRRTFWTLTGEKRCVQRKKSGGLRNAHREERNTEEEVGTTRKQRTQKREALFLQLRRRVHVPREEGRTGMRRFRGQEEGDSSECLGGGRHVVPVLVPTDFGSRRQAGLWGDSVLRSQINGMRSTTEVDETDAPGLPERKAGPGRVIGKAFAGEERWRGGRSVGAEGLIGEKGSGRQRTGQASVHTDRGPGAFRDQGPRWRTPRTKKHDRE